MRSGKNSGFTLVEVLISTAIMGLVGLVMATALELLSKIQQNTWALQEAQQLESLLKKQLAKPDICKEILAAKNSAANAAGLSVPKANIISTALTLPYTIYKYPSAAPTVFLNAGATYGRIRISSLDLRFLQYSTAAGVLSTPAAQTVAGLEISITKLGTVLGSSGFTMTIPVNMILDTSAAGNAGLISCSLMGADLLVPQCGPGQHLTLAVQSGGPSATQWSCQ